jgi:alkanesulfonate monooxygenase SsuD/methylene tetrahydromethanopterin reductase-like flavin-dependent oxidoreductase (luciferase family)
MKELWTAESPTFAGKYVSFNDVSFLPRPVQQPHMPLLIGGTGPRPLRRVAEIGDGWFPMTATIAQLERGVVQIKEEMARRGRDSSRLWVGYTGFAMGSDPETARMRHNVGHTSVQEGAIPEAMPASERSPDDAIAEIARLRAAGVTHLLVGFAWRTASELMAGMQRFARNVMPAFART